MYFGPGNNPRLEIGPLNQVAVDAGGKIHLLDDLEEYKKTVGSGTWNAVVKLADELREKKVKIGFFSSTPQGGGVALMRHALVRFLTALDVDVAWCAFHWCNYSLWADKFFVLGMCPTRPQVFSARRRTTTIFCKELRDPISASRKQPKISSTHGSRRMG
jgi:hypothetical protein